MPNWLIPLICLIAFLGFIGFAFRQATMKAQRAYRVIYHIGDTVDLRTKAMVGRVLLTEDALTVAGPSPLQLPVRDIRSADLFRMHGLGRCIKISYDKGTVYISVIRFQLFGYFALINFFGTGELAGRLRGR
jgi:hypothetical protein